MELLSLKEAWGVGGIHISVCKYLKGRCNEDGTVVFSVVHSNRIRQLTEQQNKHPGEVVESPSRDEATCS